MTGLSIPKLTNTASCVSTLYILTSRLQHLLKSFWEIL